jgi:hypothetical protein
MSLFHNRNQPVPEPAKPSVAATLGISPPKPSPEHLAGIQAAAQINARQTAERYAAYDLEHNARKKASAELDDAIWKRVLERRQNAIG